jgi:uncharacterized repeat protein (TIGR03809 family)
VRAAAFCREALDIAEVFHRISEKHCIDSFVASASVLLLADFFMTQRHDASHISEHAQDILNRWCIIAEQRLDYLTELYESGRWRRYHSENAFMENLREAKGAVETWRALAHREATPDNRTVDWSWLDQPAEAPPVVQEQVEQSSVRLLGTAAVHAALASIVPSQDGGVALDAHDFSAEEDAVPATEFLDDTPEAEMIAEIAPDRRTVQERYPMLQLNVL